jgi:MFS family permease
MDGFGMKTGVKEAVSRFIKTFDRRSKVMLATIGLYNFSGGLPSKYAQLYVAALGADALQMGSLYSIGQLVYCAISAPMGWFIDRHGAKRAIILGLILSVFVSGIYGNASSWLMLIPAMILYQISFNMVYSLPDMVLIESIKPEKRGQSIGFARTIGAIPSIFTPIIASVIVIAFGGITAQGIRPLYTIQMVLTLMIILFVAFMMKSPRDQPAANKESKGMNLIEGFRELFKGEKGLKKWTIVMSLWYFASALSVAYVPLWMVNVKGADPYILGIMSTLSMGISTFLQMPIGRLADKIGRKKAYYILRPVSYLGTLILIFAPAPNFLIIAGVLGAMGMMEGIGILSSIPFMTMYWELVPTEKRGRWFGFTGIFNTLMTIPAFMLGGFLWEMGMMELVILLPVFIEMLVVIPILSRIPDTLGRSS